MGVHAIQFLTEALDSSAEPNRIIPIFSELEENRQHLTQLLEPELCAQVLSWMERGQILGDYRAYFSLPEGDGWLLFVGLGSVQKLRRDYRCEERLRGVCAIAARFFRRMGIERFTVEDLGWLVPDPARLGLLIAEGVQLGTYRFETYRSQPKSHQIREVVVRGEQVSALQRGLRQGQQLAQASLRARDLINTPSSDLLPMDFAREAAALAEQTPGLTLRILGKRELEMEQMNLHLAVARGADSEPCLCILEWDPLGEDEASEGWDLALVGKGVTFDSGGYDLKPSAGMRRMYRDMAGAAGVFGAMKAIADLGLRRRVVGLMPLAENLVNGRAFRAGDIIRSRAGITVEIANTDAEGRLLLADSLHYAVERYAPTSLVNIATLTGSVRTALGLFVSGLCLHSDSIEEEERFHALLKRASRSTGEWVWQLPLDDDYKVQLGSLVADIQNCNTDGKSGGGAITAAMFLKQFIDFDCVKRWAHLDIAATAFMERTVIYNKLPYLPREGATGVGARLLAELASILD